MKILSLKYSDFKVDGDDFITDIQLGNYTVMVFLKIPIGGEKKYTLHWKICNGWEVNYSGNDKYALIYRLNRYIKINWDQITHFL